MLNKVMLIGNLGKDPEIKTTSKGDSFARLSLATSKKVKDETKTQWHSITVWDPKKAELLAQYTKKGSKIYVEGELETRSYEKDGQTHYATDIVVGRYDGQIRFLSSRGEDGASAPAPATASGDSFEDEVPF